MREYLGAIWSMNCRDLVRHGQLRAVRLVADPIRLPTDRAVTLGVIVNELVSNACKYAYARRDGPARSGSICGARTATCSCSRSKMMASA